MATQLENNTENLQAILMAVSELPSASTGNAYAGPMPIAAIKNGSTAYYEATCEEITELYNGLSVTIVPDVANTAEMAGFRINGGTIYSIYRRGIDSTHSITGDIPVGFIKAGVPIKLTYYTDGMVGAWVIDDIPYLPKYVVASGTSGTWQYTKWSDNTVELTGSVSIGTVSLSAASSGVYSGSSSVNLNLSDFGLTDGGVANCQYSLYGGAITGCVWPRHCTLDRMSADQWTLIFYYAASSNITAIYGSAHFRILLTNVS